MFSGTWIQVELVALGLAALFVAFGFALLKGGPAERLGATLNLGVGILATLVDYILSSDVKSVADLALDAGLAIGFLILAVRFAKLWLGVAMILQAVQFSMHAYYIVAERPADTASMAVNNLDSVGIVICILVGTAMAWRRSLNEARAQSIESV